MKQAIFTLLPCAPDCRTSAEEGYAAVAPSGSPVLSAVGPPIHSPRKGLGFAADSHSIRESHGKVLEVGWQKEGTPLHQQDLAVIIVFQSFCGERQRTEASPNDDEVILLGCGLFPLSIG